MKSKLGLNLYYHKSGAMKKIFVFTIIVLFLGACKKSGSPSSPKEIQLAKVFVDDKLESEFIFNSDKQLKEERYFKNNDLSGVTKYTYNAQGYLTESNSYKMPEKEQNGRNVYTVNGAGRIARNAVYDNSGDGFNKLNFYIDHEYDANGRCTKQIWKPDEMTVSTTRENHYYPNGNLRVYEVFYHHSGSPEKQWSVSYNNSDSTLPVSFYNIKAYPVNYYYPYLLSSVIEGVTYDDGNIDQKYQEIITDKKYNKRGLLSEAKVTTKYLMPVKPDYVRTLKFEYVEL